jgi:hypothetical protein
MKKIITAIALAAMASSSFAGFAPVSPTTTSTPTKETDNKFYAGLNWTLGGGVIPQLVLGFRNAKVESGGSTYGTGISMSFHLNKFAPGKLKLGYFDGQEHLQGEGNVGYDFSSSKFLFGLGAQGPYVNGGVDYLFGDKFDPYFGINTIDYKKPAPSSTLTCPTGFHLSGATCLPDVT